ncbi:hypothetical protein evm_009081 [Chilo suppressalis]|nr:hypothetical protein evm_009081 [Chilo suppressalis]
MRCPKDGVPKYDNNKKRENNNALRARWRRWLERSSAIVEVKQLSQWSVIGWATKNLLSRAPPCFRRHVKPLVPATFAVVVSTYQSALGPRHGPISLFHPWGRPSQQWGH